MFFHVKSFFIDNIHFENSPSGAVVKIVPGGGIVDVKGIYTQFPNNTVLDICGGGQTQIKVEDFAYLPSGCQFKASGSHTWTFINSGVTDFLDTAHWVDGILPSYIAVHGRNFTGSPTPTLQGRTYKVDLNALTVETTGGIFINSPVSIGANYITHKTAGLHRTWTAWDPGTVPAGGIVSQTFTVPDADTSHKFQVTANLTTIGNKDIMISASVSASNTVKVILFNPTGSDIVVGNGYALITVRQWL